MNRRTHSSNPPDGETAGLASHRVFQAFLLDIEARHLAALRHLLECPLCQQVARTVLFSAREPAPPEAGGRPSRKRIPSTPPAARKEP
jgi:hypothetical protein